MQVRHGLPGTHIKRLKADRVKFQITVIQWQNHVSIMQVAALTVPSQCLT